MLHPREDYARIQDPAGLIPVYEPVFLMRAQDKIAARIVREWAAVNIDAGGDPVLSQMAREHADKMDAWPVHKLADLPSEQPAEQPTAIEESHARAAAAAKRVAEPESTSGSGVVSKPAKQESNPDAGVLSKPEKSQNRDGSGVS